MIAAVEDALSEAVVRRIIGAVRPDLTLFQVMRKSGSGYLRSKLRNLNQTAKSVPVLVLIDQDRPQPCPAELIRELLPVPQSRNLLFRVVVLEIEAWLMADREGLATFLGVSAARIPENPETILNPKEFVVTLARRSRKRDIRDDLVPRDGDVRRVGPGFNTRTIEFARTAWDVDAAARSSTSLSKTVRRLRSAF